MDRKWLYCYMKTGQLVTLDMYILGANMYSLSVDMFILGANMYH